MIDLSDRDPLFFKQFEIAAKSEKNVLITGPTGTGKSVLAKKIHNESRRYMQPFVVVNLATLHEGTLEAELFGHERGAFTGADRRRLGRLELAHGGTLFLDEVGELSLRMQARLLDFLQLRSLIPLGSAQERRVDARVIAATHKNLRKAVFQGEFREDLLYRLQVIGISLRSLKERSESFGWIVHETLQEVAFELGRCILKLSHEVAEAFERYDWPGNLRELRNVLEYAVLSSERGEILLEDLPQWFLKDIQQSQQKAWGRPAGRLGFEEIALTYNYRQTMKEFQKKYFAKLMNCHGWRIGEVAKELGLGRMYVERRMRECGFEDFSEFSKEC